MKKILLLFYLNYAAYGQMHFSLNLNVGVMEHVFFMNFIDFPFI